MTANLRALNLLRLSDRCMLRTFAILVDATPMLSFHLYNCEGAPYGSRSLALAGYCRLFVRCSTRRCFARMGIPPS